MLNKVTLIGNVGQNPEIKELEGGKKVASFSLATSENYKDREGNKQTNTEWHSIVIWGKLADIVESYVKQGSQLYLEGKLRTRSWEDKETKAKRYATEIICDKMNMLGGKPDSSSVAANADAGGQVEDMPF